MTTSSSKHLNYTKLVWRFFSKFLSYEAETITGVSKFLSYEAETITGVILIGISKNINIIKLL